ncbi:MAG: alpha/beta hydrolase family protein [Planctomycetota bacterium]
MALIQAQFRSETLACSLPLWAFLPDQPATPLPVLYLLHGYTDDASGWTRYTSVCRYARDRGLALIMPEAQNGWYTTADNGPDYAKYVLEDVVGFAERVFPVRKDRAGRAIGGLSMGGYGALRLGLARPDMFASIHSHSGALLIGSNPTTPQEHDPDPGLRLRLFGEDPTGTDHDLNVWAQRTAALPEADRPAIRVDCGRDDFLFEHSQAYSRTLADLGVAHENHVEDGDHDWGYWDRHIPAALDFHVKHLDVPTG